MKTLILDCKVCVTIILICEVITMKHLCVVIWKLLNCKTHFLFTNHFKLKYLSWDEWWHYFVACIYFTTHFLHLTLGNEGIWAVKHDPELMSVLHSSKQYLQRTQLSIWPRVLRYILPCVSCSVGERLGRAAIMNGSNLTCGCGRCCPL